MTKTHHTPGPWVIFSMSSLNEHKIMPAGRDGLIADLDVENKDSSANASLIAAAPDLLEVAQLVAKGLRQRVIPDQTLLQAGRDESCLDMTPLSKIVNDAIAKATAT